MQFHKIALSVLVSISISLQALCQDSSNVSRISTLFDYEYSTDAGIIYDSGLLYIGQRDSGLKVINVQDINQPVVVGSYRPNFRTGTITLLDSIVYLNSIDQTLSILRIGENYEIDSVGGFRYDSFSNHIFIKDSLLFRTSDTGIHILSLSERYNPTQIGYYPVTPHPFFVYAFGNLAYAVRFFSSIMIINIEDPEQPEQLSTLAHPGQGYDMTMVDQLLFLADGDEGLKIIDMVDPLHPELISTYDTNGDCYQVIVSGSFAYVADGSEGIIIIDISNINDIKIAGFYRFEEEAYRIELGDDGVFFVGHETGLGIYRFTPGQGVSPETPPSPSTPLLLSTYPNPFNSMLKIEYATSGDAFPTRLAVFGLDGRLVADHPPFNSPPASKGGKGVFVWNAAGFPAGSYIVRIDAGGIVRTERIMLVK